VTKSATHAAEHSGPAMTGSAIIAFRLVFTVAILVITHLATTSLDYPLVAGVWDKLNHFLAFAVLAMLLDYSFPKERFGLWKFGSLCGYGVLLELIQYYLPYRFFSLFDVFADGLGIGIYWLCGHWLIYVPGLKTRWQGMHLPPPV
jgi:VanZ family protein|tara:strand:- start:136 stop:573 length:438 start_codon:yes stop_codon:yes gene_type:complete